MLWCIVCGMDVFLYLLSNVVPVSLAAGPSEYGAVNGGAIITFTTN